MTGLFATVLSNTLVACILAAAAWLAARCRRPALAHVLWILVLLKLCTPPLFRVQLGWLVPVPVAMPAVERSAAPEVVPAVNDAVAVLVAPAQAAAPVLPPIDLGTLLLLLWLAGSVLILVLIATRTRRLCALLGHARKAPQNLGSELTILCRRLGIRRAPELAMVNGRVTPMLWASPWRARILLPAAMCAQMSASGMRALLAHELAHWKRRDHQVRWLELACGVVFWWHPLLWCARRGLRSAEEDCCDAWVVWALPDGCRAYAEALVQTVQFLSSGAGPLPMAATGIGPVQDLNRRLTMIMKEATPRSLSRLGRVLVLVTAASVLPTLPAFAQDPERRTWENAQKELPEHPEQVKEAFDKMLRHHQELVKLGRHDEAKAVQLKMKQLGGWITDQERQDPEQKKPQGIGVRDDVFDALKKGVMALRERGDEQAAATLLYLMEEMAAKKQRSNGAADVWRKDELTKADKYKQQVDRDVKAEKRKQPASDRDADVTREKRKQAGADVEKRWINDQELARVEAEKAELPTRKEGPDQRVEELARQVERLTRLVEQLAGRLEDEKKVRSIR